ncbi:MAG: hypothetical protein IT452_13300 [Planctomycetia bacterium]|nr:hypothetical protein [Planctomycetia bacterium]
MDSFTMWARAFPIATIVVCVIALILIKKVFGKSGPSEGQNWIVIVLFAAIVGAVALAAWGFRNVKPPDNSGMTWK